MRKQRLSSPLGEALRELRVAAGLSKGALARKAGITLAAIRRAESGAANMSRMQQLADVYGLELQVRGYGSASVGEALKLLRQSRHISVSRLVELAGVPPATIVRIERKLSARISAVEALARTLGVELAFAVKRSISPAPRDC